MRYLIVGMSHVESLRRGWDSVSTEQSHGDIDFLNLRGFLRSAAGDLQASADTRKPSRYIEKAVMAARFREIANGADVVVFCLQGNQHNVIGLTEIEPLPDAIEAVESGVRNGLNGWLQLFRPHCPGPVWLLQAPPPIESEAHIYARAGTFRERLAKSKLRCAPDRLELWRRQCRVTEEVASDLGISLIALPAGVMSPSGFMAEDCYGADATHGNATYGARVMEHLLQEVRRPRVSVGHPYVGLPLESYWKSAVSSIEGGLVDPVVKPRFSIGDGDKVATAGSCFAQHISKRLRAAGFSFLVTEEPVGNVDSASERGFYDFSARYGNVYTARQLLQLFDRAFGYFHPLDAAWRRTDGGFCDPFRPRIEPDGFAGVNELLEDSQNHLAAVRRMFETLDVFIFTLGLTECWISKLDGAAYPIAPGVAGGSFDPHRHAFVNFTVSEVKADLEAFLSKLKLVNARARVLLTVSPVPLAATREDRHVLVASTYSKSVLRVAAEEVVARYSHVEYFPSYEIITGPHASGAYFTADRRTVTEAGVNHVMRVFMNRMTTAKPASQLAGGFELDTPLNDVYADMAAAAETACDEELYSIGVEQRSVPGGVD